MESGKCVILAALMLLQGLVVSVEGAAEDHAEEWSYLNETVGPANWSSIGYPLCNGANQSPIDILPSQTIDKPMGNFTFVGFNSQDMPTGATWKSTNNGHSVKVALTGDYLISEGGLPSGSVYKAAQFHFHWGSLVHEGSEHHIDGSQLAGELHIVTFNTRHADIVAAVTSGEKDALSVLGFLIGIQTDDNPAYASLFEAFSRLQYADDEYMLPTPVVLSSLLPSDMTSYYRYSGSLTTPGCNEVVLWTVFKAHIMLSERQFEVFRGQFSNEIGAARNHTIQDTLRPPQPLNSRIIYNNVDSSASEVSVSTVCFAILIILATYFHL